MGGSTLKPYSTALDQGRRKNKALSLDTKVTFLSAGRLLYAKTETKKGVGVQSSDVFLLSKACLNHSPNHFAVSMRMNHELTNRSTAHHHPLPLPSPFPFVFCDPASAKRWTVKSTALQRLHLQRQRCYNGCILYINGYINVNGASTVMSSTSTTAEIRPVLRCETNLTRLFCLV